jgi:hypothetical protein
MARLIAGILIVIHTVLGGWALVGFAELLLSDVPWTRVSNPLFSRAMLLLQWVLIGTAAAIFLAGYFRRWKRTPLAMLFLYSAMAGVCAYQTFFILTSGTRFLAMAGEYVAYALILGFLFFSNRMRLRFS